MWGSSLFHKVKTNKTTLISLSMLAILVAMILYFYQSRTAAVPEASEVLVLSAYFDRWPVLDRYRHSIVGCVADGGHVSKAVVSDISLYPWINMSLTETAMCTSTAAIFLICPEATLCNLGQDPLASLRDQLKEEALLETLCAVAQQRVGGGKLMRRKRVGAGVCGLQQDLYIMIFTSF